MFRTITEYTALSPGLAQAWWQALSKARWSVPRSWLADVRYFDSSRHGWRSSTRCPLPQAP